MEMPTLFWLDHSDQFMTALATIGLALSFLMMLGPGMNAFVVAIIWLIYQSFVQVGQLFYGYGWEMQTLETLFIAIFMCPAFGTANSLHAKSPPSIVSVLLLLWLEFR
mgnify:CR=1 FL=1